jgi:hypothetical protein
LHLFLGSDLHGDTGTLFYKIFNAFLSGFFFIYCELFCLLIKLFLINIFFKFFYIFKSK